jgi:hypothetical protein
MLRDEGINTLTAAAITLPKIRKSLLLWQILPCTFSIILTPFIALIYSLTQSQDAGDGSFSIAQAIHGMFCMLMVLSLFITRQLHLLGHQIIRLIPL